MKAGMCNLNLCPKHIPAYYRGEKINMPAFIKTTKTSVGFGISSDEANEDAYINACTISLANDVENKFRKRREELHPWMPLPNVLHISGIGCLVYENKKITETASGTTVIVASTGISVFQYLSILFERRLKYTDIVCTVRAEFDTFFTNISDEFMTIKDMPLIQTQRESADFEPRVLYGTDSGITIGCTDGYAGIKYSGEDCYYVCPINKVSDQMHAIHRLLYRTGSIIIGDRIEEL